jgi:NADH-quinone oxidoreductase subunit H
VPHLKWLFPIAWFLIKTIGFAFCYIWFRASLPRFRYDQLMDLGWKRLIPLSLGWMLIVAGFLVAKGWGFLMAALVLASYSLLTRAFSLGQTREVSVDSVLPIVGERPLPGEVLRSITDEESD